MHPGKPQFDEPVVGWSDASRRRVIVHYHLFKNAGTSVDAALRRAFGERWVPLEGEPELTPDALRAALDRRPNVQAVGSHTAVFPVPERAGTSILPVVFVRHPIDRVRSVYDFERRQFPMRKPGAFVAKVVGFRRYVEWRLGFDELFRNFQVDRLSRGLGRRGDASAAREYAERLPFVGVVEQFGASMAVLEQLVRVAYPHVSLAALHENGSSKRASSMEARLARTRDELGAALYDRLVEANEGDLALHAAAQAKLDRALESARRSAATTVPEGAAKRGLTEAAE